MKKINLVHFFLLMSISLFSATVTWNGGTGDWDIDANWDTGNAPTANDLVVITAGTCTIPNGYTAECARVDVGSGASLEIESTAIFNVGGFTSLDGIYCRGTITNHGEIDISNVNHGIFLLENNGATFINESSGSISIQPNRSGIVIPNITAPLFENFGDITIDLINATTLLSNNINIYGNASSFFNYFGGTVVVVNNVWNTGAISVFNGAEFTNNGNLTFSSLNYGLSIGSNTGGATFQNQGNGSLSFDNITDDAISLANIATASMTNSNLIEFEAGIGGHCIKINNSATFTNNSLGEIKGTGEIDGINFTNNGTLAPGLSVGELTMASTYDHTNAIFEAEIEGNAGAGISGGHDLIDALGSVTIGGTLNVSLLNGFQPGIGDTYTILNCAGGCSGTFSSISLPTLTNGVWLINYNPNNVTLEVLTPLTAELLEFNSESKDNTIHLTWHTASETNNAGFELQKSRDATNWQKLNWVEGKGNSVTLSHYNYVDTHPFPGTNYYRLKQVDFDGSFEYSDIISIEFLPTNKHKISLYPNPANETITISVDAKMEFQLQVFDVLGRLVHQEEVLSSDHEINISDWEKGWYIFEFSNGNERFQQRVLKI